MPRYDGTFDIFKPVNHLNNLYLLLLAFLGNAIGSAVAASTATQNQQHKRCLESLDGNFNVTRQNETCNFSFSSAGIKIKGTCKWCPAYVPTPKPTRRPIKTSPGPTPPPTNKPVASPTPEPTNAIVTRGPTRPTKRPTRPPHPTHPPTHRPTCMPAIALSSNDINSKLLAAQAAPNFLNTGLMRVVLDGLVKYCAIMAVGNNLYQLPATCMFSPITGANGVVTWSIPSDWYASLELKSGFGDFETGVSYPGASQAFYPEEFLGPNSSVYNFAFIEVTSPISTQNEFSTMNQPAWASMLQQVEKRTQPTPTARPMPNKPKGLRV